MMALSLGYQECRYMYANLSSESPKSGTVIIRIGSHPFVNRLKVRVDIFKLGAIQRHPAKLTTLLLRSLYMQPVELWLENANNSELSLVVCLSSPTSSPMTVSE